MNAFEDARTVERASFEILKPYLTDHCDDGRFILTDKGPLARVVQETMGDVIAQKNGAMYCIEVKAEEREIYGNFFLEEWSNRSRFNRGWLDKLDTDLLFYHFVDDDLLYIIPFGRLRRWAFVTPGLRGDEYPGRIYDFKSKVQNKRMQRNDTWGRCVPIGVIGQEVGFKEMRPKQMVSAPYSPEPHLDGPQGTLFADS